MSIIYHSFLGNFISRITGFITNIWMPPGISHMFLLGFAKIFGVNLSEAEHPIGYYHSFNHFFTRKLKSEARKIDSTPTSLVSPVDGRVLLKGKIEKGQLIQAKGLTYSLNSLIGDDYESKFEHGYFMTIYLAPHDCHRIFSPVNGKVEKAILIPGLLLPVRSPYIEEEANLYTKNERLSTILSTDKGLLAVVKVGAFNVGSITVPFDKKLKSNKLGQKKIIKTYNEDINLNKGEHLGTFHLGSTVVILIENNNFEWKEDYKRDHYLSYGEIIGQ